MSNYTTDTDFGANSYWPKTEPYPGWPTSPPFWEQPVKPFNTDSFTITSNFYPDLDEIRKDIEEIKEALKAAKLYKKPTKKELRIKELLKELKELTG